jgi:hypothetical protein
MGLARTKGAAQLHKERLTARQSRRLTSGGKAEANTSYGPKRYVKPK